MAKKLKRQVVNGLYPMTEKQRREIAEIRRTAPTDPDLLEQSEAARAAADMSDVMSVLKAAREDAGISLRELEEQIGISRGNLSRLENGTGNPTIATLKRYAEAIGRTVTVIVE